MGIPAIYNCREAAKTTLNHVFELASESCMTSEALALRISLIRDELLVLDAVADSWQRAEKYAKPIMEETTIEQKGDSNA